MRPIRSPRRTALVAGAVYLAIVVAANVAIFGTSVIARASARRRGNDEDLPDVRKLRHVEGRVYASGQPEVRHYERLAACGFSLVIDLRAHGRADPKEDDEDRLADVGIAYLHVPVTDGRAPDRASVEAVVSAVDAADGKVLLHCGAGVGRSTSTSAAYLASRGRMPSVVDQLAVGPLSLEQLYFVAALGRGDRVARNLPVELISRYVVDAPRRLWHLATGT